jgi:hypothetical protein
MSLREKLIEIETKFWEAPPDGSVYREHMVAGGRVLMPLPAGIMNRERTIEAIDGSPPWTDYEFEELEFYELSDDSAILTYNATATRKGMDDPYRTLITSTYRKQDNEWKLVTHQQTPLDDHA